MRISHSNPRPFAVFFLAASYDGVPLHFVPAAGIGQAMPRVHPSLLVPLFSDREGMWGRTCPGCKGYFRTNSAGDLVRCVYCQFLGTNGEFATRNQLEYIGLFCRAFLDATKAENDVTIDLDRIADGLSANTPAWVYSEERQQRRITCKSCHANFDVLGEYASCPRCGKRNNLAVLIAALDALEQRYTKANAELQGQAERADEWQRLLNSAISHFEGMSNDIRAALLRLPYSPSRRAELENLSFQNIGNAAKRLRDWLGIDLFKDLKEVDQQFLIRAVNKRHLFTHRSGVVDQEYITNTGDTTVRIGQRIRIDSGDVSRIIRILRQVGTVLADGYESIT